MSRAFLLRRTIHDDLSIRTLTDQGERAPEARICISRRRGIVEIREHGLAKRFGAAKFRIDLEAIERRGGEPHRRVVVCGRPSIGSRGIQAADEAFVGAGAQVIQRDSASAGKRTIGAKTGVRHGNNCRDKERCESGGSAW